MKKIIYSVLLFPLGAFTQQIIREFGQPTQEELQMVIYEKNPEAAAVVLYDGGKSYFFKTRDGYDIRFKRHKMVKILDKKAVEEQSEVSIPFYDDGYGKREIVQNIEAITYNFQDGMLIRKYIEKKDIFQEKVNEYWGNFKFSFPDVQKGSILEMRYEVETPFNTRLPDWEFQDKIPTVYSEYEVSMIPFYEYVFLAQGMSKWDFQNSYLEKKKRTWQNIDFQDYVHIYALRDVPAFTDLNFITSKNDYIIKIDFQLSKINKPRYSRAYLSTWPALNKALLQNESFGKYLKNSQRLSGRILEGLNYENLAAKAKAIKVINYVKENFEWDGFHGKYASKAAKKFLDDKNGSIADINLFLTGMLRAVGLEAYPVILSTRDHGKIPVDYPFKHFTNYVVVMVNAEGVFLSDASEPRLPYYRLPIKCLNGDGLIVNDEDEVNWVKIENNIPSLEIHNYVIKIDSLTMDADYTISMTSTEYDAYSRRSTFNDDRKKIKDYYEKKFDQVNEVKTRNFSNSRRPYSIYLKGRYETDKIGNSIALKPFFNKPKSKNPFTQQERNYPVDFIYPWKESYQSVIEMPIGYKLYELPKAFSVNNDIIGINLVYGKQDGKIKIKGDYELKKAFYGPDQYKEIKAYYEKIIELFNNPIVLEKSV